MCCGIQKVEWGDEDMGEIRHEGVRNEDWLALELIGGEGIKAHYYILFYTKCYKWEGVG